MTQTDTDAGYCQNMSREPIILMRHDEFNIWDQAYIEIDSQNTVSIQVHRCYNNYITPAEVYCGLILRFVIASAKHGRCELDMSTLVADLEYDGRLGTFVRRIVAGRRHHHIDDLTDDAYEASLELQRCFDKQDVVNFNRYVNEKRVWFSIDLIGNDPQIRWDTTDGELRRREAEVGACFKRRGFIVADDLGDAYSKLRDRLADEHYKQDTK